MRKCYLWIVALVMSVFTGLNTYADVTIKVNMPGVVVFNVMGQDYTIDSEEYVVTPDKFLGPGQLIASLKVPANAYTMTVRNVNKSSDIEIQDYDGEYICNIHPGNTSNGDVLEVTVTSTGGGNDPIEQNVTFLFVPEGAGFVVTTHFNDAGMEIEDEVFNTPNDMGEIVVPYNAAGGYIIKPNPGFTLLNAKDETNASNPHYTGVTPRGDGWIHDYMGTISANAVIVVTASQAGSFSVKGVGEHLSNISMINLVDYTYVNVTDTYSNVSFNNGASYNIYSNTASPLWKVEVTNNEGETEQLEGIYGNFTYTPNAGDKVSIFTDCPETHANIKISLAGEGVNKNIVNSVSYANSEVAQSTWASAQGWNVVAGDYLKIKFDAEGYVGLSVTVNGVAQSLYTDYTDNKKYIQYNITNDNPDVDKLYEVVISARKEHQYNVTLVCEHPEAVSLRTGAGAVSFTTSPAQIKVSESNNILYINPNSGWKVEGILVDGSAPDENTYIYNSYYVSGDCEITINVADLTSLRTKTAVVYVDESVANPVYLTFKYQDGTEAGVAPGYNFVKYCDEDLPFSMGYYGGGDAAYYINGEKVTMVQPAIETLTFEDGGVIKIYNSTPTSNVLTYDIDDEVSDLVEIYHDHTSKIDHTAINEYACFPGTMVHFKPAAASSQLRARSATVPFEVAVNDEKLEADGDGVYSFKVTNEPASIKVAKAISTGVEEIDTESDNAGAVYNLQGIVVKKAATMDDVKALPAGVYVINGKKVIVK